MATSASLTSGIAARYASSLFDVALEAGAADEVESALERFDAMMRESDDLMRLVRSPVFSAEDQTRAVGAVLDQAGFSGLFANFVRIVARNRRLFAMPLMLAEFRKLLAAHRGEASAEVTVAHDLGPAQMDELKEALKGALGKDVAVNQTVDPTILGGMIVKIGSRQIDTSLRTKLSSLKLALKEVG